MQKIAIIYGWIDKWGGAERILPVLFTAFPQADLYTLYTDFSGAQWALPFRSRLKTTKMQFWRRILPFKSVWAPLMPIMIESLDLSAYTDVFSISSFLLLYADKAPS